MSNGVSGLVALILEEMGRVQEAAVRRWGAAESLGMNCVLWALLQCRPGCLELQDQVAGIVVRACVVAAERHLQVPVSVLEVAAGKEDDWDAS